MRERRPFRPAVPESLEGRVLLHGGAVDSPTIDTAQQVQVSTAGQVFDPLMGRILTADYVFGNHLSRHEALTILTGQIRVAYSAFRTGLDRAMDGLASSGDLDAFDADVAALSDGLAARFAEILSTSPRAQRFLVPSGLDAIDGSGADSLMSQLMALSMDTGDPSAFSASRSDALGVANDSLRAMVTAMALFDRDAFFPFPAGSGSGETGGDGSTNPPSQPPAAPTNLTAVAISPSRIDLSWAASDGATGYVVERSSDGTNFLQVGTTAAGATTFSDTTGLTPGTTFTYRVRANNASGQSDPSAVATAATAPAALPDAPAGFVLSPIQDPHHQGLAMHIHPHLTIIINGQQQVIPAFIGLTYPNGASNPNASFTAATPIHTHDSSGNLHVESTEPFTFRLKDFFDVWSHYAGGQGHPVSDPSIAFNSQGILGHLVDATHTLTMTVNGQPSTAFENLPLNDPDGTLFSGEGDPNTQQIVIDYEPTRGA